MSDMAQLRVPPHSLEAESSVLGALLLDAESWDRIGDLLTADDFYRHEHRMVFEAITSLALASKPADVITVNERLGDDAESIGGLAYLNSLAQYVPSAGNIRRYAEIVREKSILRSLITASDNIIGNAFAPQGQTAASILDHAESEIMRIGEQSSRGKRTSVGMDEVVVSILDKIQDLADRDGELVGTSTGFADLDRMTSGLEAGDLMIVAARPSMGKTALAVNIAEHIAMNEGLPVAVFSMEMSASQLGVRLLGSIGRINQMHLRTGKLTDEEWPRLTEAIERMRQVKIEIDESGGQTIGELRTNARRMARRLGGKLGLIVVDYLQLMGGADGNDENRATVLGEISRGLKLLAKELGCPVIALSQLNRAVEQRSDKRPVLSDIRESGSIEQDADIVAFIYRDDYYNKDSKEPGVAEVILAKNRNGPTGTVKMAFIKAITRFESLAVLS